MTMADRCAVRLGSLKNTFRVEFKILKIVTILLFYKKYVNFNLLHTKSPTPFYIGDFHPKGVEGGETLFETGSK